MALRCICRKGPAVRGPRAQADRKLYAAAMQAAIRETANLSVIEGEADELLMKDGRVTGIRLVLLLERRERRPTARPGSAYGPRSTSF